jgi:hypothetical protein
LARYRDKTARAAASCYGIEEISAEISEKELSFSEEIE